MPSIKAFHEKAASGEPVTVVFFGGSLTWGANASNPQTTSYRGRMTQWLQNQYPKTPFTFHDAAIGGTGSQLGLFRFQRDVLAHQPDLVFLDFSVNDEANGEDSERLATYERIVRELLRSGVMVMPVLTMFKWHVEEKEGQTYPTRHRDHLKIADAYQLPAANVIPYVRNKVAEGADINTLWPFDGAHPDDPGYELFFEAVRDRYLLATKESTAATVPDQSVFLNLYPQWERRRLVEEPIPQGWTQNKTYRTSLWFDGLSSRWMDDVLSASFSNQPDALEVEFEGTMVAILGERNGFTPPIKVWIDGAPMADPTSKEGNLLWSLDTSRFAPPKKNSGNLFLWKVLATGLKAGTHRLRIEPVWEGASPEAELRLESLCAAGHP